MAKAPSIHQHTSSPEGALVNAYLVEAQNGVVAVDSMLTLSAKATVVAAVHAYLPAEELHQKRELSIEPVAAKLGLLEQRQS